jgi:thioredoxin 1
MSPSFLDDIGFRSSRRTGGSFSYVSRLSVDFVMNKPIHISGAEFEDKVLNSELPVIVDFWAPWCGPCKMIAPVLEKIAEENDDKLRVARVNTDENPEWAMHFGVQGIPTLLFVSRGIPGSSGNPNRASTSHSTAPAVLARRSRSIPPRISKYS